MVKGQMGMFIQFLCQILHVFSSNKIMILWGEFQEMYFWRGFPGFLNERIYLVNYTNYKMSFFLVNLSEFDLIPITPAILDHLDLIRNCYQSSILHVKFQTNTLQSSQHLQKKITHQKLSNNHPTATNTDTFFKTFHRPPRTKPPLIIRGANPLIHPPRHSPATWSKAAKAWASVCSAAVPKTMKRWEVPRVGSSRDLDDFCWWLKGWAFGNRWAPKRRQGRIYPAI